MRVKKRTVVGSFFNVSFLQCLALLILLCTLQIIILEFYIDKFSKPIHNAQYSMNEFSITKQQYNVVINYLMNKNVKLSAQIKDLIYNKKMSYIEELEPLKQKEFKPQPKPYKTMEDIKLLIPLPLIEDGLHENTFNWIAHKLSDYKMCYFLSSNYYENINSYIDSENIAKINKFISNHKHIPNHIKTIEKLIDIPSFTISTYNTWNINPFINERMIEIAHILSQYHVDIVALQEIRWTKDKNGNNILQHELILNELQNGDHHSSHHHGINNNKFGGEKWNFIKAKLKLEDNNDEEYLVIASKFIIDNSEIFRLKTGNKKNRGRILLYGSIIIPTHESIEESIKIDVFHTHFGLNAEHHCLNILEIIDIVNKYHKENPNRLQIVLGDFNSYLDYQYPMDILTLNYNDKNNDLLKELLHSKCGNTKHRKISNDIGAFNDAWNDIYGDTVDVYRTFTNFEDHRIEDFTATDRILYRNGNLLNDKQWQVCDVWIAGDQSLNIKSHQKTFASDHRTVITKMYYNYINTSF